MLLMEDVQSDAENRLRSLVWSLVTLMSVSVLTGVDGDIWLRSVSANTCILATVRLPRYNLFHNYSRSTRYQYLGLISIRSTHLRI